MSRSSVFPNVIWAHIALFATLLVCAQGVGAGSSAAQLPADLPVLGEPVLVTTLGQSPGSLMIKMLCDGAGVLSTEAALATVDDLNATAYSTLIVTMGTSLKGMGAAGIDIDFEINRVSQLIDTAHELGMTVVGAQIEGPSRRVDESDEASIRTVAPRSDILIIHQEINDDGYFTTVADEQGIPLILIEKPMDVQDVLAILFGKN